MFHVGQLVVCVNDGGLPRSYALPKKGLIYTVREVTPIYPDGFYGILLAEVRNVLEIGFKEPCFDERRFRPVDTHALDVFRTTSTPVTEDA